MWILYFCVISYSTGELLPTDFRNSLYPVTNYSGSRVLETDFVTQPFVRLNWTLSGTVDSSGARWVVNSANNVIVKVTMSPHQGMLQSYGEVFAGKWGLAGHFDGSAKVAQFNLPTGIGVYEPIGKDMILYVSDTNNHCVRKLDFKTMRTSTLAGGPERPGLLDGDGVMAKFKYPSGIGIDASSGDIFVLDNEDVIRMLRIVTQGQRTTTEVTTLVRGACRAMTAMWIDRMIMREVWCHTDWRASLIKAENVTTWEWKPFCVGHALTCSLSD